jgi:hypothetical protein
MPMTIDHPLTREDSACPLCHDTKPIGNVVCWPCFRWHDMRYGAAPMVTQIIDAREVALQP